MHCSLVGLSGNFLPFTATWWDSSHPCILTGLALIADLVRVGIFEREDDLVEERRVIRSAVAAPCWRQRKQAGILHVLKCYELGGLTGNEGHVSD